MILRWTGAGGGSEREARPPRRPRRKPVENRFSWVQLTQTRDAPQRRGVPGPRDAASGWLIAVGGSVIFTVNSTEPPTCIPEGSTSPTNAGWTRPPEEDVSLEPAGGGRGLPLAGCAAFRATALERHVGYPGREDRPIRSRSAGVFRPFPYDACISEISERVSSNRSVSSRKSSLRERRMSLSSRSCPSTSARRWSMVSAT